MPKVEFIEHKGLKVMLLDVSFGSNARENLAAFDQAREMIAKEPPKSVRLLTDVTRTHYTTEAVDGMKEFSKAVTPHILASAAVGVSGIKRIVLQSLIKLSGRHIEVFEEREKALDWLAEQ
jgi:hypothetical protein